MNRSKAYEWLTQPGLQATLYHYDDTTNEALKTAVQSLVPAWIPVTERLPEKTGKYLVSMRNGNVYTKCFDTFTNSFGTGVTAWMELPEAYEEDDK